MGVASTNSAKGSADSGRHFTGLARVVSLLSMAAPLIQTKGRRAHPSQRPKTFARSLASWLPAILARELEENPMNISRGIGLVFVLAAIACSSDEGSADGGGLDGATSDSEAGLDASIDGADGQETAPPTRRPTATRAAGDADSSTRRGRRIARRGRRAGQHRRRQRREGWRRYRGRRDVRRSARRQRDGVRRSDVQRGAVLLRRRVWPLRRPGNHLRHL